MTTRRGQLARSLARPFAAAAAALAYLLLPLLYVAHVGLAHGGDLTGSVARHFLPRPATPAAPGEHHHDGAHCDLCRLLAGVAAGGEPPPPVATVFPAPTAVGRVRPRASDPVLRRVLPVALQPRAPPFC